MFHVKPIIVKAQQVICWAFILVACNQPGPSYVAPQNNLDSYIRDSINKEYVIKDTNSVLYVHDDECTECLEAYADSGQLYIPGYVALQMRETKRKNPNAFFGRDLFITGKNYANVHLFDPDWYGEDTAHYGPNYKFFGRVIGISGHGLIFRLDSFKVNQ